jgi:hypothetical protein
VLLGLGETAIGEKLGDLGVELLEKLRLLLEPVEDDEAVERWLSGGSEDGGDGGKGGMD